ncbi:MAG: aminoacyl-tRNA hydrolase [Candidatus Liptonbacteria bacterium]|nr:aminoacyl-tRNA hydrolase [Candidatus Liptonbacteria bacterium]
MKDVISRKIEIVVGLGNPGDAYKYTYHNLGFLALEYLALKIKKETGFDLKFKTSKSKKFSHAKACGIIFLKPLTFMNEVGQAVKTALKFFKIPKEKMLVIHDESDLNLGDYRFSFNRGSAGHRGVESIIKEIGSKSFVRLRIGVRHKESKSIRMPALRFILKKISPLDRKILYSVLGAAMEKLAVNEKP